MIGKRSIVVAFVLFGSAAQAGECVRPRAPIVPDGLTATDAQMADAIRDLERYRDEINAYLACIDAEYQRARQIGEETMRAWNQAVEDYSRRTD